MPSKTLAVTLPQMGESVTEGVVGAWRKQVGDRVTAGETLVEIQTDKIDAEVPAPASGVLSRIVATEGEVVAIGAPLAEMALGGAVDGAGTSAESATGEPDSPRAAPADPVAIPLPALGESVTEGVVGTWHKQPGDRIEAGQTLVEIQTDKVDAEVPAPVGGRVLEVLIPEGETVSVGTVIARIQPEPEAPKESSDGSAMAAGAPREDSPQAPPSTLQLDATPLARRAAAIKGVDLRAVAGTGPGGLIRRDDVSRSPTPAAPGATQVLQIKGSAAKLVDAMEESLAIPTATSFRTLEVPVLELRRRQLNEGLAESGRADLKVSFTHLLAFALVRAARDMPVFSAGFSRQDGAPQRVVRDGVNLGLAVDVERGDGSRFLLVPVIRGAHLLKFPDFRAAYEDLVRRTRSGGLSVDDLAGATITLTNPGGVGTVASVPRLMAGQSAIVAVGAIGLPPGFGTMSRDDAAALGVQPVMTVTSTYDHRLVQGLESGMLLQKLERLLAGDGQLYEDVFGSLQLDLPALDLSAPARRLPLSTGSGSAPSQELMWAVAAGMSLVKAYRTHGHLAARLDPLGSEPPGDPSLEPSTVGLNQSLMARIPAEMLRVAVRGATLAEALPQMRQTYCGTLAYEIEHISSHEQRTWLRSQIESGANLAKLTADEQRQLLHRLAQVDAFERFLRKTYLGQHTFSIEGVDALVPMLEHLIELLARDGTREVVLGMAHRGRLNVTARIVGRSLEDIIAEFESGAYLGGASTGDVKYHYGAEGVARTRDNREVGVVLTHNPSHLEVVNAVVEGRTRARQTKDKTTVISQDTRAAIPVLIHGDAAFTGQGVVTETLNLQSLEGYRVGGTIHIIANNQIGFTTLPDEGRSTRYASDVAKGYDIPIVHVNGDDVEACLAAVRLAVAYRATFERDVLIDLIGYRRLGHNEGDEPAYTQPLMMAKIRSHPTPVQVYGKQLVEQGVVSETDVEQEQASCYQEMADAHARAVAQRADLAAAAQPAGTMSEPEGLPTTPTAVSVGRLAELDRELGLVPEGFQLNPKLNRFFAQRPLAFEPPGRVLWAQAEALAFASLITEGVAIRLTGQDTERGTFSQRHLVLHDVATGSAWAPIQHLADARATFEVHNSPLSEVAAMGFEYGFGVTKPEALVLWEAQYGDFFNNAQVVIDQFVAAGQAKWDQESRLTLLLPHGYEGSGPEHSSARIERFLELAAEGNIRVAYPSTAAQYFHLLRLQALAPERRPLIVFTPKSGLRLQAATASADELATGSFEPVLMDPAGPTPAATKRLLLATGKVAHELMARRDKDGAKDVTVVRLELLYPFAATAIAQVLSQYRDLSSVAWVQEEPKNMGAFSYVAPRLQALLPVGLRLDYVGRRAQASPSEGSMSAHLVEQERLVREAVLGALAAPGKEDA
ncbi:MAG: multifunctional oxoglutarate decarboxylase/oxoglutarate dehydrogenase thiamine pyrophosphate-binding subunit/dihydrolipoyllysine-residue succinyltransferase subunit [Candidatus Dormibacteraeota bacterium]|nr:multifunctional oxoglutarate decarboxylase/oxoglutarate dehydrogenase thiamine pyrophosphate-binding subunit/dihydrolipoyllysine-residue succinyltransferase subunit [Candidatus Dormibacteraeota bacterium]